MATDGEAHPPEFWAQVTAEHIAPISDDVTGQRRMAALQLQTKIAEALTPHHSAVQSAERDKLKKDPKHHERTPDSKSFVSAALDAITQAAKGTEWEDHLTLTRTKPTWLDAYLAKVEKLGGENVPLDIAAANEKRNWDRQQLIARELETHFNTVQQIEKSWHRDRSGIR